MRRPMQALPSRLPASCLVVPPRSLCRSACQPPCELPRAWGPPRPWKEACLLLRAICPRPPGLTQREPEQPAVQGVEGLLAAPTPVLPGRWSQDVRGVLPGAQLSPSWASVPQTVNTRLAPLPATPVASGSKGLGRGDSDIRRVPSLPRSGRMSLPLSLTPGHTNDTGPAGVFCGILSFGPLGPHFLAPAPEQGAYRGQVSRPQTAPTCPTSTNTGVDGSSWP